MKCAFEMIAIANATKERIRREEEEKRMKMINEIVEFCEFIGAKMEETANTTGELGFKGYVINRFNHIHIPTHDEYQNHRLSYTSYGPTVKAIMNNFDLFLEVSSEYFQRFCFEFICEEKHDDSIAIYGLGYNNHMTHCITIRPMAECL